MTRKEAEIELSSWLCGLAAFGTCEIMQPGVVSFVSHKVTKAQRCGQANEYNLSGTEAEGTKSAPVR